MHKFKAIAYSPPKPSKPRIRSEFREQAERMCNYRLGDVPAGIDGLITDFAEILQEKAQLEKALDDISKRIEKLKAAV